MRFLRLVAVLSLIELVPSYHSPAIGKTKFQPIGYEHTSAHPGRRHTVRFAVVDVITSPTKGKVFIEN